MLSSAPSPTSPDRLCAAQALRAVARPGVACKPQPDLSRVGAASRRWADPRDRGGARGSRTYGLTAAGLAEVRRWLRETEPDRRVRSDAALRVFFLWLLEPAEARAFLERERAYLQDRLQRYERIRAEDPVLRARKQRAFGSRSKEASARWRRGSRDRRGGRGSLAGLGRA